MAKYLKMGYYRKVVNMIREEGGISMSRMLELLEEEVIKNYEKELKQDD